MSIKYSGENVITYLLTLLKSKFDTKVDKVSGKGLSTNDYTTEEKSTLATLKTTVDGLTSSGGEPNQNAYSCITARTTAGATIIPATSKTDTFELEAASGITLEVSVGEKKVTVGAHEHANKTVLDSLWMEGDRLGFSGGGVVALSSEVPKISQNISADSTENFKGASPKAVKTYVDDYVNSKISSTYKPAGSVAFASLPTLSDSVVGNVYNITNSFTTTASFVEGAGKSYPAGTNVVVIKNGSNYSFDVLSGFVDLSGYVESSDITELTNAEIESLWTAAGL